MIDAQVDLRQPLKEYFGFNGFKGNQEAIIKSLLDGNDTFVIMPTGGGKSLCYQLPAIISEGTALIISPLIALMKNQVDLIRSYSSIDNIAHFLNSSLTRAQAKMVKEDLTAKNTKLLYVAPETLTKQENIDFFKELNISFVAVDEAHCISEWGHDFRPEYRRIREMIEAIGDNIPIIALTATATPKVRSDIAKNLKMKKPNLFISSFLRENLVYEVRPKAKKDIVVKDIVKFIKGHQGKSGIIYCLNRKTTEELAEVLNVNGIRAAAYHAGLDGSTRTKAQDMFLMEDVEVICATIAFGMGIDKPDVRFVIHFNIPKSLENYYQETGRAGRDGLEGVCVSYFSYNDINKLEKFLRDKPVAEREIAGQHLIEVSAYAETTQCRRQFLLHYFGEEYDTSRCGNGECDNCKYPREKVEAMDEMKLAIEATLATNELHRIPHIVNILMGKNKQEIKSYRHDQLEQFGKGQDKSENFWNSLLRHGLLNGLLHKDIEEYGVLKVTDAGRAFVDKPKSIQVPINNDFEQLEAEQTEDFTGGKAAVLDSNLLRMLKDLRKKLAKQQNKPPFVIFQDPSLEDMATQYPITSDEMANIVGVSKGKALRYGRQFAELIKTYVEENDIDRPQDFTVKSVVNKSGMKVYIIQNIDRKIPLNDIARAKDLKVDELVHEMETIVASGTKLDINYHLNEVIDEDTIEMIYDYFSTADTDDLDIAFHELEDEGVTVEEIQLVRLKFMSEVAN